MPTFPRKRGLRRSPGRPPASEQQENRERLLEAAGRLFAHEGAERVSLRRVAEEAGLTSAMVHYYFGDREGLYDALFEWTFARLLERVRARMAERDAGESAAAGPVLGDLLDILTGVFTASPWLPTLVVREVLVEGGSFRERFIRDYAAHLAVLLPGLMRREIEAGRFRAGLDPELAFLSLMGMSLLPLIARPVIERVLEIDYDADFLERFAEHTRRLFLEGAQS